MSEKKNQNQLLKAVAAGVGGALVVAVVLLAFVWPTKTLEIRNVPIAISGSEQMVSAFEANLEKAAPGKLAFLEKTSRTEAVNSIESRESFGAIVLASIGEPTEVIIAPAANAAVSQQLTAVAQLIQSAQAAQVAAAGGDPASVKVTVTNLVPLAETDPTGSGLAAAAFPLTLGGLIGGLLVALVVVGRRNKLAFGVVFALATGLSVTAVMQLWFEFFQGDFWMNSLAVSCSVAATTFLVGGLQSLIGQPGIGIGAAFTMLIANPISSAAVPWQFIAEPWGEFGQYLIPGVSNWMIRGLSYFPTADLSRQWLTLGIWIAFGLLLLLVSKKPRTQK